jgi:hypothetical protein
LLLPAAAVHDRTPPVFAGLRSATTCIPGPVGGERTAVYHLRWSAARDAVTPGNRIVYLIYLAPSSGAESFATPTWRTRPGVTSFATPRLSTVQEHFFVVRARDAAGNHDHNLRERRGANLCL